MRILFLDVDGVLNHSKVRRHPQGWTVNGKCLEQLKRIIKAAGCNIVLSSSWRFSKGGKSQLLKKFQRIGLKPWIDVTSLTIEEQPRSKAIQAWLKEHKKEVEAFAILDDDKGASIKGNFFQTSWEEGGLTPEIADQVISHLS